MFEAKGCDFVIIHRTSQPNKTAAAASMMPPPLFYFSAVLLSKTAEKSFKLVLTA
ncbi:MAG: hypothetical protein IPN76_28795 [Saprospiraceae bacterium]|nr:hypothetical protein [Saprospiraceae bacterium]